MNIALLHDHYDEDHLRKMIDYMGDHGVPPVIKAVWMECYNFWAALEGCHRIRAAKVLGLPVIIDEIDYSDAPLSSIGITDIDYDYTVSEIVDDAHRREIITI